MCMGKNKLTHARTCVYNVNYHIVWSTKYRQKVLNSKIETRLKEILLSVAKDHELKIVVNSEPMSFFESQTEAYILR